MKLHRSPRSFAKYACTALLSTALLLAVPATGAAQQDWPLRCNLVSSGSLLLIGAKGFQLSFRRANTASRTRQPGPGECAWEDRVVREDEPNQIVYRTEGEYRFAIDDEGKIRSALAINSRPPQGEEARMQMMVESWRNAGMITFYVRNTGRSMEVTRITR